VPEEYSAQAAPEASGVTSHSSNSRRSAATPKRAHDPYRPKGLAHLIAAIEHALADHPEAIVEGVWLDLPGATEPVWIDAQVVRRRAGKAI
jgi:hypothetical protein